MKINRQIFDRLDNISWFTNCGAPLTMVNIDQSVVQVDSWEQAKEWYLDESWEHATLEARNALTEFLHNKYPNKYIEWNQTVRDAKEYIESSFSDNYKTSRSDIISIVSLLIVSNGTFSMQLWSSLTTTVRNSRNSSSIYS